MPRESMAQPALPKLFRRGKKNYYYFRRHICGKDKWICTETSVYKDARAFLKKYMLAEIVTVANAQKNKTAHELGNTFVETFTNTRNVFTPLSEAHQIWKEHCPKYSDLSKKTRKMYNSIFDRFVEWCSESGITHVEAIDNSTAIKYSKHLWEKNYAGRTYNMHIKHLSRVFTTIDSIKPLPHRNPFNFTNIPRIKKNQCYNIH